jgi:hypothetical protein
MYKYPIWVDFRQRRGEKTNEKLVEMYNTRFHWRKVSSPLGTWTPKGSKQYDPEQPATAPLDWHMPGLYPVEFLDSLGQHPSRWLCGQFSPSDEQYFDEIGTCKSLVSLQRPASTTFRLKWMKTWRRVLHSAPRMDVIVGNTWKYLLVDHCILLSCISLFSWGGEISISAHYVAFLW